MKPATERRRREAPTPYTDLLERSSTLMQQERALQQAIYGMSRLADEAMSEALRLSKNVATTKTERQWLRAISILDAATFFDVVERYERSKRKR